MAAGVRRLEDRVAIITGAARGIGQAYAVRLASEGAHVVAADLRDCGETAAQVRGLGRECLAVRADVGDGADATRLLGPDGVTIELISRGSA